MVNLQLAINPLLGFVQGVGIVAGALLAQFEDWLRNQLEALGIPDLVQTAIMVGITIILIVWAVRLFAGLIRVAAVTVLVLMMLHLVAPITLG